MRARRRDLSPFFGRLLGGGGGGSPGGSGLELPVSGAVLVLDAIELAGTYANGAAMSTWADLSGEDNHATQATTATQPLFTVDAFGTGQHGVSFDGFTSKRTLALPDFLSALSAAEVFAVLKSGADPATGPNSGGFWDMGGAGAFGSHHPYSDGVIYESFGSSVRYTVANPTASLTAPHLYNISTQAGSYAVRLDGESLLPPTANTVAWPTTPKLGISSLNSLFSGQPCFFNGVFGSVIVFPGVLTASERNAMAAFLLDRWPSLPAIYIPADPGGSHAYWRIKILTTTDGGAQARVGELEFRATAGGADLTTGGAPVATSQFSSSGDNSAAAAFDGNPATAWANVGALPAGLGYHLSAASTVDEIMVRCRNDGFGPGDSPKDFAVESSDDGTHWNPEWSISGQTGWSAGEIRVFTRP